MLFTFARLQSVLLFVLERTACIAENGLEVLEETVIPFCSKLVDRFVLVNAPVNALTARSSPRLFGPSNAAADPLCESGSTSHSPTPAHGPEFTHDMHTARSREFDMEDFLVAAKRMQQVSALDAPMTHRILVF